MESTSIWIVCLSFSLSGTAALTHGVFRKSRNLRDFFVLRFYATLPLFETSEHYVRNPC